LDPTEADVRRRRTPCGREEARPEHVDRAIRRLLAVTGSSSAAAACYAALCPAVARLGSPLDGLASDADVAAASHSAPSPDAVVGSPAAAV
jgi:hypothetical protein